LLLAAGHMMSDVYGSILVTLLPVWVELFNLSFSSAGFLVFLRSASMTIFEPLGGHVADQTSRSMFAIGLVVLAVSMSAVGWAPGYLVLVGLILIGTVGHSFFGPQATSAATRSSSGSRGLGVAVFLAGGSVGAALGPISVASLVNAVGIQHTWWLALPGLLLAFLLYKRFATRDMGVLQSAPGFDLKGLVCSRPALALAGVLLLRGAAETGILAFAPILVQQKGGSLLTVGATVSLFKLSGAVGAILAGYLSDRMNWKPLMAISFVVSVLFLYSFLQAGGVTALLLVVLLGATLLSSTSYTLVVAQNLLPGRTSTAAGLVYSIGLLGGGLGALCEGFLADRVGVQQALLILGATLPLGAAAATLGIRDSIHVSRA
jgi:FSR family fosmidomycin resistance protein-like MFS transporter